MAIVLASAWKGGFSTRGARQDKEQGGVCGRSDESILTALLPWSIRLTEDLLVKLKYVNSFSEFNKNRIS